MIKVIQLRGFIPTSEETLREFTTRKDIPNTIAAATTRLEIYRLQDDSSWQYIICEEGHQAKEIEILKDKLLLAPNLSEKIKSAFSNITTLHRSGIALSANDLQTITSAQSGRIDINDLNSLVSSTETTVQRQMLEYAKFALFCKGVLRAIDEETSEDNNNDYTLLHGDSRNQPVFTREKLEEILNDKWNALKEKEAAYIKTLGFRDDTFTLVGKYLSSGTILAAPEPEE